MTHVKKPGKMRWVFFVTLAVFSLMATGCEQGSLGVKNGAIKGVVLDKANSQPIPDVLVRGTTHANSAGTYYRNCLTGGDGVYVLADCNKDTWDLTWEKSGWVATTSVNQQIPVQVVVTNGETVQAPVFWMTKSAEAVKGTLRGYPVDFVTGAPLTNFTVTMKEPSKYKTFEMAQDFKDAGWTGLDGGNREFSITCENYETCAATGTISASPFDLGVVKMQPQKVSIQGTLRNLPGYILGDSANSNAITNGVFWVEAAGKVVATGTPNALSGTVVYNIPGVPVTAGAVAVKCKLRGYDVVTVSPSLSIPKQRPGGVIGGVDADFANVEPIRRDVRVIIKGTAPEGEVPSSVDFGEIIRVYCRQGGRDVVPYVDVVGNNYIAEAYFAGVISGYSMDFLAVNQNRGYISQSSTKETIPEDGNSVYTIIIDLTS